MTTIKIIDAPMGAGKTMGMINHINNNANGKFMFITPFLTEVQRIIEMCPKSKFKQPKDGYIQGNKIESIKKLIISGENIVSTHSLFKRFNSDIANLINEQGYVLILDEVIDVIDKIDISIDDIETIKGSLVDIIKETGEIVWTNENYTGAFSKLKEYSNRHQLYVSNNDFLHWELPYDIFNQFTQVFILTYMFDGQVQRMYMDLHNLKYEYMGVKFLDDKYCICDLSENQLPKHFSTLKEKIHILEDDKLNQIGNGDTALSVSWFKRNSKTDNMKQLKNNLVNLYKNKYKCLPDEKLWTCWSSHINVVTNSAYGKRRHLAFNSRATNAYSNCTHLAYCCNVYVQPEIQRFFADKGFKFDQDSYALSYMVQWLFRGAIRNGQDIWLYIPSKRMRNILKDWISKF